VLVISEDLGEILETCNQVAVIAGGKLSPVRDVADTNAQEIGTWMSGLFPDAGAPGHAGDAATGARAA
jgi:ABC-type sugar transport system ATPase subunit